MPNDWRNHSRKITVGHEVKKFTKAFRDNFATLMISSLGLLVALTWNDFWRAWIATLSEENGVAYKFVVAFAMTILAVVLTYLFTKVKNPN